MTSLSRFLIILWHGRSFRLRVPAAPHPES